MRVLDNFSIAFQARFWGSVAYTRDGCWYWQRARDPNGYGRVGKGHQLTYLAHRVAWALTYSDPGDQHVLHRCDMPSCVNPAHLFLGTNLDNIRDCTAKRRRPRGETRANSKLTPRDVFAMRKLRKSGFSYWRLGADFGVAHTTARRICLGITWNHLPLV